MAILLILAIILIRISRIKTQYIHIRYVASHGFYKNVDIPPLINVAKVLLISLYDVNVIVLLRINTSSIMFSITVHLFIWCDKL